MRRSIPTQVLSLLIAIASTSLATPMPSAVVQRADAATSTFVAPISTPTYLISDDGTCGGALGKVCLGSTFGPCCSKNGYCGTEAAFCAAGCQRKYGGCNNNSEKQSPDGTCGGVNGYTCLGSGFGSCCSQYGWCGDDAAHCDKCLVGFGVCSVQS